MGSRRYRKKGGGSIAMPLILAGLVAHAYGFTDDMAARALTYSTIVVMTGVIVYALVIIVKRLRKRRSLRNADMAQMDVMGGLEFEYYIAALLKNWGFSNVKLTERYDWGVDIIADKDGVRWGIQTKRSTGMVKVAAVRQVVAGLHIYGCERGIVITNGVFNRPAIEVARVNDCALVDRSLLARIQNRK
jgi:restriction system protein